MSLTSTQYTELHAELTNDPLVLGYNALLTAGNEAGIAAMLNQIGVGAAYSIFKNNIPSSDVIRSIANPDFVLLNTEQLQKLTLLFTGVAVIDATDANTRANFVSIFTGMGATIANLTALAKRQGSRIEFLFGAGTVVHDRDISTALKS